MTYIDAYAGSLFEKRLIEAYIAENGKDPVNGEELAADELIEIKTQRVVRPRPHQPEPTLLCCSQPRYDLQGTEARMIQQACIRR